MTPDSADYDLQIHLHMYLDTITTMGQQMCAAGDSTTTTKRDRAKLKRLKCWPGVYASAAAADAGSAVNNDADGVRCARIETETKRNWHMACRRRVDASLALAYQK